MIFTSWHPSHSDLQSVLSVCNGPFFSFQNSIVMLGEIIFFMDGQLRTYLVRN